MAYQILLVDDDSAFREELRDCLEGYTVMKRLTVQTRWRS